MSAPAPIREVYERYRHLDHLLSDPAWMVGDADREGAGVRMIALELWQAVKRAVEPAKEA